MACNPSTTGKVAKTAVPLTPPGCHAAGGVVQFASGHAGIRYWCSNGTVEFRASEQASLAQIN
ncbi:hypothetical protein GN316_14560 [Xylophilus sp. Kf1]|nr:hypothetical protein [Xylophilus sp. Kf1]